MTRRQGLAYLYEKRLRWQLLLTREINACDGLTVRQAQVPLVGLWPA